MSAGPEIRFAPHNLGAEQGLLGAVMVDNSLFERVAWLDHESFFDPLHARFWELCADIIGSNGRADPITLRVHFGEDEFIDQVLTVRQYLGNLTALACVPSSIGAYARQVQEMATRRHLIVLAEDAIASAYDAKSATPLMAIVATLQEHLHGLAETSHASREIGFDAAVDQAIDMAAKAYTRKGALAGIPTGLDDLDRMMGGLQASDLIVLAGRPSMGKEQALDAPILMADGKWKSMSDLRLGDKLASPDREPSRVAAIFPQGIKQLFHVEFSDGRRAEAGAEHLWRVHYRSWDRPRILTTSEVEQKLKAKRYRGRLWLDLVSGDFGSEDGDQNTLDPYSLGSLLANGGMTGSQVSLTMPYEEITRAVVGGLVGHGVSVGSVYGLSQRLVGDGSKSGNFALNELRRLGLHGCRSEAKFIPPEYMRRTRASRMRLLAGLIDGDGWVGTFGALRYATSSPTLARDIVDLVRSLGGIATTSIKNPSYTYLGEILSGRPSHVINMMVPGLAPFLQVGMKRDRLSRGRTRSRRLTIKAVTPSRIAPAQCIRVTHTSSLYVTSDYVLTHNTALATNIAVTTARGTGRDPRTGEAFPVRHVHFFSQEMSAAQLAMRVISEVVEISSDKLRRGDVDERQIEHVLKSRDRLAKIPMTIDETGGITLAALAQKARRIKRRFDTGLIIVDYIQLMSGGSRSTGNRVQEISAITAGLKALAKELDVPILALSQLSRKVEERSDKRPQLADLRESGAIEQDADIVLFVYRDDYYLHREEPDESDFEAHAKWSDKVRNASGKAEVIIAKARHAATGRIELSFQAELTRFANLAKEQGG